MSRALGLVETHGLVAAIEAADAGLKAADVELLNYEIVKGGLITVKFWGEVAAVKASVEAAVAGGQKVGKITAAHVITGLAKELTGMVRSGISREAGPEIKEVPDSGTAQGAVFTLAELEKFTVTKLRQLARTLPNLSLVGRQISRANKQQLIEEILKVYSVLPGGEE